MRNRIEELFDRKSGGILSVYFTAGFPGVGDTMEVLSALQEAGADMVEIGMPYSDPVADGPTIQASNMRALNNGMSVSLLLDQLRTMRQHVHLPVLLMGYVNPVLQYGVEKFCEESARVGVDGIILPDLPREEYEVSYKQYFDAANLINVPLITPQTSPGRIREIDTAARGFIYMVSTSSTTGARYGIDEAQIGYFERVRDMHLGNPLLIGFGISDAATFSMACGYAQGAIIGSAFIKVIERSQDLRDDILAFIGKVKGESL